MKAVAINGMAEVHVHCVVSASKDGSLVVVISVKEDVNIKHFDDTPVNCM
jgi:hypothetical protein